MSTFLRQLGSVRRSMETFLKPCLVANASIKFSGDTKIRHSGVQAAPFRAIGGSFQIDEAMMWGDTFSRAFSIAI